MPTIIHSDKALLDRLYRAQLERTRDLINDELAYGLGDDGHDDLDSALTLMDVVHTLWLNDDTTGLDTLLNVIGPNNIRLADYACDGVARAFYDLNCPAMAYDEATSAPHAWRDA